MLPAPLSLLVAKARSCRRPNDRNAVEKAKNLIEFWGRRACRKSNDRTDICVHSRNFDIGENHS
jgi:hypothetical protein